MKIELEVSEVELNLLNASLRVMEQLLCDTGSAKEIEYATSIGNLTYRIGATMGHFFRDSGFDEPTTDEIDALVRKIIGDEDE